MIMKVLELVKMYRIDTGQSILTDLLEFRFNFIENYLKVWKLKKSNKFEKVWNISSNSSLNSLKF